MATIFGCNAVPVRAIPHLRVVNNNYHNPEPQ